MILYCPAKINIGLRITSHRPDGFHNLQSVMLAVGLCDILEILPAAPGSAPLEFTASGIHSGAAPGSNLVERAFDLIRQHTEVSPVRIHLHKQIPVGAGLGGGSSDATHALLGLNKIASAPLSGNKIRQLAEQLGSDCPFFLYGDPMLMEGRGEILSPVSLPKGTWHLVLLFPGIPVSTATAYSAIQPGRPEVHLKEQLRMPMNTWRSRVVNDFEKGTFKLHPLLGTLKDQLYDSGAVYASMSGSGSALYGLFSSDPVLPRGVSKYLLWKGPVDISGTR